MLLQEFNELTGIYPSELLYAAIERAYMESNSDKRDFCRDYKANKDGIADRIAFNATTDFNDMVSRHVREKDELLKKVERLTAALELEQEWKPYQCPHNVSDAEYRNVATVAHELSDDDAKTYLSREFGFAPDKIRILRQVNREEVNRHGSIRTSGTIERNPLYLSTDDNYIRFDVAGWSYECLNGELRKFF